MRLPRKEEFFNEKFQPLKRDNINSRKEETRESDRKKAVESQTDHNVDTSDSDVDEDDECSGPTKRNGIP